MHSVGDAQSNEPYQAAISVIPACLMERTTQTGLLLLLQCEICPALIDWTERKMACGRTIDEVDQVSKRQAAGVKLEVKFEIYSRIVNLSIDKLESGFLTRASKI